MVERGKGPEFPTGAPEIEAAPNFSGEGNFLNPEHDSTDPTPAAPENIPTPTSPTPEQPADSTGPIATERAEILNISDSGDPLATQDTMEGIFLAGTETNE